MPQKDYQIGALWMEGPLSFLEQLCLKSFVDAGHHVKLYQYGTVTGVPDGIEIADANEVLPRTNFLQHERTGSPALHSDLFRYKMLEQNSDTIWADTDAYCMRRFETPNGHFYGWESSKHINGGVLGLPSDSDTLRELLDYTTDEFAIPAWYGEDYVRELEAAREAGNPVHASEQPWGVWGPHAVTYFLHKTGEAKYALPQEGLYPFTFKDRRLMLKPNFDTTGYITGKTYSVHLYGRRMRARIVEKEGGKPHRKSLLGRLLIKHDIDPEAAPIRKKPAPKQAEDAKVKSTPPQAQEPRTDLCRLAEGLDRGPRKHRYTELYDLLLTPLRRRQAKLLELGPSADSLSVWHDYLPKAQIFGIDQAPISGAPSDRVSLFQTDLGNREALSDITDTLPTLDVVIDDASHASSHQQIALLELLPMMARKGLYFIESLRWQPKGVDADGFTTTAELLDGFQATGRFTHSDPEMEAELNALTPHIAGVFVWPAKYRVGNRDQLALIRRA